HSESSFTPLDSPLRPWCARSVVLSRFHARYSLLGKPPTVPSCSLGCARPGIFPRVSFGAVCEKRLKVTTFLPLSMTMMARTKNVPSTNLTSSNIPPPADLQTEDLNPEDLHPEDTLVPPPAAQQPQTGLPAAVNPPPPAVIPEVEESSRHPVQAVIAPVT
ncbi:hypothetical protein Dimus_025184, partial [Dionaea muscipula]